MHAIPQALASKVHIGTVLKRISERPNSWMNSTYFADIVPTSVILRGVLTAGSMLKLVAFVFALLSATACQAQGPAASQTISLSANITALQKNVEYVSVSFSGVQVTAGDAIAFVQNASTTNFSITPPQKFKWVVTSNSSNALTSGSGNVV